MKVGSGRHKDQQAAFQGAVQNDTEQWYYNRLWFSVKTITRRQDKVVQAEGSLIGHCPTEGKPSLTGPGFSGEFLVRVKAIVLGKSSAG